MLEKGFDYDRDSLTIMLGTNPYPETRTQGTVKNYTVIDDKISEANYEKYRKYFEESGKTYPDNYAESQYGKTILLIELNNLEEQVSEGIVTPKEDVIIKYNAKLNGKGKFGELANINEAYLEYSNDPYNSGKTKGTTTKTTPVKTYTYTIGLDLTKIAHADNNADETAEPTYLSGAKFAIYDGPEYIKEKLLPKENTERKLIGEIVTDKNGKATYDGLGVGTYYIKEIESPDGYNKLNEEIVVEVKATYDGIGINWEIPEQTDKLYSVKKATISEKNEAGEVVRVIPYIELLVENTEGFQLPVTGGIGTIIFTIIGLGIMLSVVVLLKKSNKTK